MTAIASPKPAAPLHDVYVKRLKARLAKPAISVTDARDGILDCFVSTYFEGVNHGLKQLVGVKAEPDEVARVAAQMFKSRLGRHGVNFEAPSLEALMRVKEEVDGEFHFAELPAEHRAVHDQVCTLLVAKADGSIPHAGDRSVVSKGSAGEGEVRRQLRGVLASALQEMARASSEEPVAGLRRRVAQLTKLLDTVETFEAP